MDVIEIIGAAAILYGLWKLWHLGDSEKHEPSTDGALPMVDSRLEGLFIRCNIPHSHGIEHARAVRKHVEFACDHSTSMSTMDKIAVSIAALLHDADDRKYFPKNKNYENAREIVRATYPSLEPLVIQMISYVSTSANGNSIPDDAISRPWLLYPRWADRLEAIGWIGVVRVWEYTLETKRPLFTNETPRAQSVDELWKIATEQRYKSYTGKSVSMIDHYYDKQLRIGKFRTDNTYLHLESNAREGPLIEVCLAFGRGELNDSMLEHARKKAEEEKHIYRESLRHKAKTTF